MVRAIYTAEGNTHTIVVSGHAGFDTYGRDIVCAAVSAIVQALIGWAENHPYTVDFANVEDGNVSISCIGNDDVSAVFYMTAIGIEQIAKVYPKNVKIDIIGIGD